MLDATSGSGSPAKALDREGLLDRVMGDEELASELVQDFLHDAPSQIESLNERIAAADTAGAESRAHFIKGAAAAVGAEAIWEVALELERAGKAGDLNLLEKHAPTLAAEFERLKKTVQEES